MSLRIHICLDIAGREGWLQIDPFASIETLIDAFEFVEPSDTGGINQPQFAAHSLLIIGVDHQAWKSAEMDKGKASNRLSLPAEGLSGQITVIAAASFERAVNKD